MVSKSNHTSLSSKPQPKTMMMNDYFEKNNSSDE